MSCDSWLLYLVGLFASLAAIRGQTEIYHNKHDITIPGNPGSLFGYSIAYQEKMKKLVIGAPIEDPTGNVHLCSIEKTAKCEKVYRDNIENKQNYNYWFGATVNAGTDFFMACAPRYTTVSRNHSEFYSTYGHCYYAKIDNAASKPSNKNLMSEFSYIGEENEKIVYHLLAYREKANNDKPEQLADTFGMSSYVYEKKVIYVGGPFMSIGRVREYDTGKNNSIILVKNKYQGERKVSYNFGYSITSGFFLPGRKKETIAISTPYGTIGYGRVYFYEEQALRNDTWVDGKDYVKVGSLFGACLASLTLTKKAVRNREDALLVGAPAKVSDSGYDVGAVFIYKFKRDKVHSNIFVPQLVKELLPVNDESSGGRFGASIVSIGDFDNDKISEVAVAAPFENDGRGAVYIYSGSLLLSSETGSKVPYMQLLQPEVSTLSYGWSLTAPNDADDNGCNELAIGAPFSNSITYKRCIASLEIGLDNVKFPDLKVQYSELSHSDTAFTFSPCLKIKYNEKPIPANIETNGLFTIHVTHPDVTLESGVNNGTTKTTTKSLSNKSMMKKICFDDLKVLLPKEADYDQKILFDLSVDLLENPLNISEFNPNLVLLNGGKTNYSKQFEGPKLPASNVTFTVKTSLKENYVIGSTDDAQLEIFMENSGQAAHGPCVRTRLNGITVSQMPTDRTCSVNKDELICKLVKLRSGQNETKLVTLYMKSLTSSNDSLVLSSELFTSGCSNPTGRKHNITINLTKDANIMIKNSSIPSFNVNATREELINRGKIIEHVYKFQEGVHFKLQRNVDIQGTLEDVLYCPEVPYNLITNNGFTVWKNLTCKIALPSEVNIEKVTIKPTKPEIENCVLIEHKAYCQIPELGKNKPIDVRIQMKILPDSAFADQITNGKATVDTELTLNLTNTTQLGITTIVTLWKAPKVTLWKIIVASLVGIIIIVILLWVLHECGCLQRQNKQKLQELKKEVQRQSMRKSMMLRQSVIEVIQNDEKKGERERLIKVPEEDTCSNDFEHVNHHNTTLTKDMNEHPTKERVDIQQTQRTSKGDINGQDTEDKVDVKQMQQVPDLINVQPVKEICVDDNDPARVAFNAELAKALAKGGKSVATKAEIH